MNKNLITINEDCFFISQRLKEIDNSYFLVFNLFTKKYEVHSSLQFNTYCFTIPYDTLDERTLFWANRTRRENSDRLIKEIEQNNQKIYEQNIKKQVEILKEALC